MTYQVWWSSLLMTCILFHFFSYFTDPGLSSMTTMTLSGQARVLAVLPRHCYFSPTVRTLWAIMFLKSPFPRFPPVSKLAGALLLFSAAQGNQRRASSTETASVSPSWTASFDWWENLMQPNRAQGWIVLHKSGNFALNVPISLIASSRIKISHYYIITLNTLNFFLFLPFLLSINPI